MTKIETSNESCTNFKNILLKAIKEVLAKSFEILMKFGKFFEIFSNYKMF